MTANGTIFDVEAPRHNLAFQDFSSTIIASDLPSGRISPSTSPHPSRANEDLYAQSASFGESLNGATKAGGVLNLDYYTAYFDVDTRTVLDRCWRTCWPREDYVEGVLGGVPDLYGPFWVPTTLIFSLFLTSSLTASISAYLSGETYNYDFTRLGAAVTLVYAYFLGLPILVWAALKYWARVSERTMVEIISVYGYAATIWILTSWSTLIPYPPLRALFALLATSISLCFLLRNLYPIIISSTNVSAKLLVVVVAVLHLGVCLALWFGFMAAGGGRFNGGTGGAGTVPPVEGPPEGRW